ncbi:hypothetical protein CDD83_7961 [Cordyceps sp. RAO-2017]|nr:hypothetical protein CDD83_7961 [Cordyceps sp. RAO-2017]
MQGRAVMDSSAVERSDLVGRIAVAEAGAGGRKRRARDPRPGSAAADWRRRAPPPATERCEQGVPDKALARARAPRSPGQRWRPGG